MTVEHTFRISETHARDNRRKRRSDAPLDDRLPDERGVESAPFTVSLFFGETHDVHGLHGFIIQLIVLLASDLNMAVAQETVVTERLQKKLL